MFAISVVYLGLISGFVGLISLIRPLVFLGIRNRRWALGVMAVASAVVIAGCLLPARETRVEMPRTQLDHFMPVYQFSEFHSIRIEAGKEQVYSALKAVTADEIRFFRTLVWLRRFGRPGPESILNPAKDTPLLEVATRTTFILLAEEPNREVVIGGLAAAPSGWRPKSKARPKPEDFMAFQEPGFALAAMNFVVEDAGPAACILTTETRVYATDDSARRRFAAYWRVIYPGSALIRRMWLGAIAARATGK